MLRRSANDSGARPVHQLRNRDIYITNRPQINPTAISNDFRNYSGQRDRNKVPIKINNALIMRKLVLIFDSGV